MYTEPLFGVWLSPEQVEAIFDFAMCVGTVTVTDLRDESVRLNLPPEIAGEYSDFRGSVLVEQGRAAGEGMERMAIVDRNGNTYPLELTRVRKLTDREERQQLFRLGESVLREMYDRYGDDENDQVAAAVYEACNRWDELEQLLTFEEENDGA